MQTGRVKWFNNAKGYGFILSEDGSSGDSSSENVSVDYFAHYSSIVMEGYKTLKAGDAVTFDILEGPKGSHAINIQPVTVESSNPTNDQPPEDTSTESSND